MSLITSSSHSRSYVDLLEKLETDYEEKLETIEKEYAEKEQ